MEEVTYRDDMTVKLVSCMGNDNTIIQAARVSTVGENNPENAKLDKFRFINFLMSNRHGSPFEHAVFQFYIECPIFVAREFMRHRMASYNEMSGRYKELQPVFYMPRITRPLQQVGKPGAYEFIPGTGPQVNMVATETMLNCKFLYES